MSLRTHPPVRVPYDIIEVVAKDAGILETDPWDGSLDPADQVVWAHRVGDAYRGLVHSVRGATDREFADDHFVRGTVQAGRAGRIDESARPDLDELPVETYLMDPDTTAMETVNAADVITLIDNEQVRIVDGEPKLFDTHTDHSLARDAVGAAVALSNIVDDASLTPVCTGHELVSTATERFLERNNVDPYSEMVELALVELGLPADEFAIGLTEGEN